MNLYAFVTLAGSIVTYFLYNAALVELAGNLFSRKVPKWKTWGVMFVANYLVFLALSMLQVSLDLNWSIIAILFALEVKAVFRMRWIDSALITLIGASVGLAATIVARSVCAIAFDVPLSAFSNTLESLKALPVMLGFLLAAISLHAIDIPTNLRALATIRLERNLSLFLLVELALCYVYLCTNLLLYYNDLNDLVLKLWSMKTAMFVSFGATGAIWIAYRMAATLEQAKRRKALHQELEAGERTSAELRQIAERDGLTMCFTRSYAEQAISESLAKGKPLTVVFADLNGLKAVNDRYGHNMGDSFIASAASALKETRATANDFVARYGGDEFLVVLEEDIDPNILSQRMRFAEETLRETGLEEEYPFEPTVSWGATHARANDDFASLVARADEGMYRRKHGTVQTR